MKEFEKIIIPFHKKHEMKHEMNTNSNLLFLSLAIVAPFLVQSCSIFLRCLNVEVPFMERVPRVRHVGRHGACVIGIFSSLIF
jgi:hypothetical protein